MKRTTALRIANQGQRPSLQAFVLLLVLSPLSVAQTALSGQVLATSGSPLPHVTLSLEGSSASTQSDSNGNFVLSALPSGRQVLRVDGRSANTQSVTYGQFEIGVNLAQGVRTALPYAIWMTPLDTAHAVTISSLTTSETVITTPLIPGLELHIPANTVIKDLDGNVVTQLSITAVPIDRPSFPLPPIPVPTYFTVQPGGAQLCVAGTNPCQPQGARLIYPNGSQLAAGTRVLFWDYEPDNKLWYVYGRGSVSSDGTQVVPDAGVTIYEFSGAMFNGPGPSLPNPAPPPGGKQGGEPVDLVTGLFVYSKTDLYLPDTVPLQLTRTYRPGDPTSRAFGIGTTQPYDMFLVGDNVNYSYADLILPDGGRVHYVRTSPGTSYDGAVMRHTATPTQFHGSTLTLDTPSITWRLRLKDGSTYLFPDSYGVPFAALAAVTKVDPKVKTIFRLQ